MMITKWSLIFLILLALSSPVIYAAQSLVSAPYYGNVIVLPKASKNYKIDLSTLPLDSDISLSILPEDGSTTPEMHVGFKSLSIKNIKDADYSSTSSSGNIIFIPRQQLVERQYIYVKLICRSSKCKGNLSFEFSKEIQMEANGKKHTETANHLGKSGSLVVRLRVPPMDDAERIVIHVDAIPDKLKRSGTDLRVFINQGEDIPIEGQTQDIVRTSWLDGQTIVITPDSPLFCTNCNYTLSLKFAPSSSVSIEAHVFASETRIGGKAVLDGAKTEALNTYIFKMKDDDKGKNLIVDVKLLTGKLYIFINCDTRPESLNEYYWRYEIEASEEIILTQRDQSLCQSDTYYIMVSGTEPSVYSLRAITNKYAGFKIGQNPVRSEISSNETLTYEFFTPANSSERIVIILTSMTKLNMSLTNCRFPTDCLDLFLNYLNHSVQGQNAINKPYLNESPFKYESISQNDQQKIVFDADSEGTCYPIMMNDITGTPSPVCAYKFSLYSGNPFTIEYTLTTFKHNHEIILGDWSTSFLLNQDFTRYFTLFVNRTNITEIIIKLSDYDGNTRMNLFVSKTDKYPSENTPHVLYSDKGLIILKNDTNLTGAYYITVKADRVAAFVISSEVFPKLLHAFSDPKPAQVLIPNIPSKGSISHRKYTPTTQYYNIIVDLDNNWEGSLNIKFENPSPNIVILVNNHEKFPSITFRTWKSEKGEVIIPSNDLRFIRKGTYYLAVHLISGTDDVDYAIVYSLVEKTAELENDVATSETAPQHLFLASFTSFNQTLKQDDIDYYESFIVPTDEKVIISLHNREGHADIYLSLDANNKFPNETNYTYSTKGTNRDWIELNLDDLNRFRRNQSGDVNVFYFAVIPGEGQESVSYSISLSRKDWDSPRRDTAARLESGVEMEFPSPPGNQKENFYFYLKPSQSAIVTVICPGRMAKLAASVFGEDMAKSFDFDKQVPFSPFFQYREHNGPGLVHLAIPVQNASVSTLILLRLWFDRPPKDPKPSQSNTYSILVNSQITPIVPGRQIYGAIQEDTYQYYTLNVTKSSCTLLISANILDDGDIALVVSPPTSPDELPTLGNTEFEITEKHQSKFIEINNGDIYPTLEMSGVWIIGIYGRTSSLYTITVMYEEEKIVALTQSLPFESYIKADSRMYFIYNRTSLSNLEVKIDELSGDVIAYITTLPEGRELVSHLPSKRSAQWTMKPRDDFVLEIPSDKMITCENCQILITLEASELSKVFITISEGNQALRVQNGITYHNRLNAKSSRLYLFNANNNKEAILSVNLEGELLKVYASQNPLVSPTAYNWELELSLKNSSKSLALAKTESWNSNKTNTGVIIGKNKKARQEENSFYLLFENPTSSEIKYSLAITSIDSDSVLKSGVKQLLTLDPNEKNFILYYSSKEDEIMTINIEFIVKMDLTQSDLQDLVSDFKTEGLQLEAEFFREDSIEGLSVGVSSVPLSRKNIQVEILDDDTNFVKSYHVRQRFALKSRIGKFRFSIANPFDLQISPYIVIYSSQFGTIPLEQNSQAVATLDKNMSEIYEGYVPSPGSWYMWIYSCHGDVEFTLQDESDFLEDRETNTTTLKYGQHYSYNTLTEEDITKYIKIQSSASNLGDADFVIRSSFFPENQTYNYKPSAELSRVQTELVSLEPNSNQLAVKFMSLQMEEYDPEDKILYSVRVCPYDVNQPDAPLNVCHQSSKCTTQTEKLGITENKQLEVNFETLEAGQHYLHVIAEIQHQNRTIKFISYQSEMIRVISSSSNGLSTLATVMIVIGILLLAGLIYFKCVRKSARSKLYSGEASETFLAY